MLGERLFYLTVVISGYAQACGAHVVLSRPLTDAVSDDHRHAGLNRSELVGRVPAPAETIEDEIGGEDLQNQTGNMTIDGMPAIAADEVRDDSEIMAPLLPVMTEKDFAPEAIITDGVHFLIHEPTSAHWAPGPSLTRADTSTPDQLGESSSVGTVLFLHACAHSSFDQFGLLPEESAMTREALSRGLTVLAPDAYPVLGGCWNPGTDGPMLSLAIPKVLKKWNLDSKPIYGVGISSGGVMLDVLVVKYAFHFAGLQFQVSPGGAYNGGPGLFATHPHPRTVFIWMQKDLYAPPNTIKAAADALRAKGTPVRVWAASPKPIGAMLARSQLFGVSKITAQKMIQKLWNLGYLESRCKGCIPGVCKKGHRMWLEFYRSDNAVTNFLASKKFGPYLHKTDRQPRALTEEIHVIEGAHGPTAEHFAQTLSFMMGVPGV